MFTRSIKHHEDRLAGKWEVSRTTEHSKYFHGRFNWLYPKTILKLPEIHECKIRESLDINNLESTTNPPKSLIETGVI